MALIAGFVRDLIPAKLCVEAFHVSQGWQKGEWARFEVRERAPAFELGYLKVLAISWVGPPASLVRLELDMKLAAIPSPVPPSALAERKDPLTGELLHLPAIVPIVLEPRTILEIEMEPLDGLATGTLRFWGKR